MTSAPTRALRRTLIAVLAISGLAVLGPFQAANAAQPGDPIQREDIALIEKQLARINLVIDRLDQRQRRQPNRRVILDVARLRTDVDDIRNGLRAYLSTPRMPPRRPAPLSGQYQAQRAGAHP